MTNKKVAVLGTVGVPACYGGFETLVDNLLDDDGEYTVYCSSKSYEDKLDTYKGARLVYLPFNANGVSSIFYDLISMLHAVVTGHKVLLTLGVSAGLFLPLLRIFTRRRLVTNIDGLEWKRDKWNLLAKLYLKMSERAAVNYSHVIIADNKGIADYVEREYGVTAKVIAYGGDHVLSKPLSENSKPYALSVCRIEPENNIHIILEAFSKMSSQLKFVGNWGSSEYGNRLKKQYLVCPNIDLLEPIYDVDKLFALRDGCEFYVHGHSAGGTNPSLVEAMFFRKPIVAFDCVYNRATMEEQGLYFTSAKSLIELIEKRCHASWGKLGEDLGEIARKHYCWSHIRNAYLALLSS